MFPSGGIHLSIGDPDVHIQFVVGVGVLNPSRVKVSIYNVEALRHQLMEPKTLMDGYHQPFLVTGREMSKDWAEVIYKDGHMAEVQISIP